MYIYILNVFYFVGEIVLGWPRFDAVRVQNNIVPHKTRPKTSRLVGE